MRELRTSGSVGAGGGQPPSATRLCARRSLGEENAQRKEVNAKGRNLSTGPSGYESRPAKVGRQPEASLAWWWGDPSCEA